MEPTTTEGEGRIDKRAVGKAIEDAAYLYRSRRRCGGCGSSPLPAVRGVSGRSQATTFRSRDASGCGTGAVEEGGDRGGGGVPERKEATGRRRLRPGKQRKGGRRRRLGKQRQGGRRRPQI